MRLARSSDAPFLPRPPGAVDLGGRMRSAAYRSLTAGRHDTEGEMEFRILGPLEVLDGRSRAGRWAGQRQRSLLALLLLHANQVVSSSRLIDELWPDEASGVARRRAPGERLAAAQVARRRRRAARHAPARLRDPARRRAARPRPVRASRRGGRRRRAAGGRRAAARGARALARACARRLRLRAVRAGGDRAPRGAAPARGREADRRRPRARPARRARRRARGARRPSTRCASACAAS